MTKPADYPVTPELTKQVADQCRVVVHLARCIAEVYEDYSRMMGVERGMNELANSTGKRTAHLMEVLGDILNGMDAVTKEDEWCAPIFAEAHRLWPTA